MKPFSELLDAGVNRRQFLWCAGCAGVSALVGSSTAAAQGKKGADSMSAATERIGACGLDCTKCGQYRLPFDQEAQKNVIQWYRAEGWLTETEGLKEAIEKKMYCKGCGDPDICWSSNCKIAKCCKSDKGLVNCSRCESFPCAEIEDHAAKDEGYREGVEYLKQLRDG